MTRFKKLKERIEQEKTPRDITYDELSTYLNHYGFYLKTTNGSHHKFVDNKGRLIVIPVHSGTIKYCYINEAVKLIIKEEQ